MSKTKNINQGSRTGKTIYNRIKSALAEKQKSNIDLANELEVTVETVSSWCTNSAQPSIKTLFKIAAFLNIDPGDLLVKTKDSKTEI
ncbi:MAG TPA: helix-turn-helix transcriptional regulator [Candidatus Babeliaceae bacterium]|nr:helix-turn-helix transcriptional regulator [Candidatus Babeliaceae bacterium]